MKKLLILSMLLITESTIANPYIDKYFDKGTNPPAFYETSIDKFVSELVGLCADATSNGGESSRRKCYEETVNELATYLRHEIQSKIYNVKAGQSVGLSSKKDVKRIVDTELKIQKSFDSYYNLACSLEAMPSMMGSGSVNVISICQMTLLSERIKKVAKSFESEL